MFDFVEVRVPGGTYIFFIILSRMYRRLHCRGHECSPDHHVDVDLEHIVVWLTTKFLSYVGVDLLKVVDVVR